MFKASESRWGALRAAGTLLGVIAALGRSALAEPPPSAQFGLEGAAPAVPPQQQQQTPSAWPPVYAPPYPGPPASGQVAPPPTPGMPSGWGPPPQSAVYPAPRLPDAAPAASVAPAEWSLGVGLQVGVFSASTLNGRVGVVTPPTPDVRLSLERRVGESTWLVLNALAFTSASTEPVGSDSSALGGLGALGAPPRTTLAVRDSRISVLFGVRQIVVHAVVDLSVYGALFASYETLSGDDLRPGESVNPTPGSNAGGLGLVGGIAVERELIPGLALRLTANVVEANTTKTNVASTDGQGNVTHTKFVGNNIGLDLSPGLDLQFYF